jgi:hypothetical protein
MEDYIFLIIAVVISIFAAIKKNKRKAENVTPIPEKEEEPDNFLLDRLFNLDFPLEEEDHIPAKKVVVPEKEPMVASTPMKSQLNYQSPFKSFLPDRSGRITRSSLKKEVELKEEDFEETEEQAGYMEDFTLRKAFVYSEIMNPKYLQETEN